MTGNFLELSNLLSVGAGDVRGGAIYPPSNLLSFLLNNCTPYLTRAGPLWIKWSISSICIAISYFLIQQHLQSDILLATYRIKLWFFATERASKSKPIAVLFGNYQNTRGLTTRMRELYSTPFKPGAERSPFRECTFDHLFKPQANWVERILVYP